MKPNAPSLKRNFHYMKDIIGRKKFIIYKCLQTNRITFYVQQSTLHRNHPLMTAKLIVKITKPKLVGC